MNKKNLINYDFGLKNLNMPPQGGCSLKKKTFEKEI